MTDTCLNCGTPLEGRYCHACGQKAVSLHLGVHDFVHEATHEFLHLDGKIRSTVKFLLTRPGQLTKEVHRRAAGAVHHTAAAVPHLQRIVLRMTGAMVALVYALIRGAH
jgi:hypothetical protein